MGPLEAIKPWSTAGLEGPRRFLKEYIAFIRKLLILRTLIIH